MDATFVVLWELSLTLKTNVFIVTISNYPLNSSLRYYNNIDRFIFQNIKNARFSARLLFNLLPPHITFLTSYIESKTSQFCGKKVFIVQ